MPHIPGHLVAQRPGVPRTSRDSIARPIPQTAIRPDGQRSRPVLSDVRDPKESGRFLTEGELRNLQRRERERAASAPEPEGLVARIADTVINPAAFLAAPALIGEAISPENPFSGFVRNIGSGFRESLGHIINNISPGGEPLDFLSPDLPTTTAESIGRGIGVGLANIPFVGSAVPSEQFIANRARIGTSGLDTALINLEIATLPIAGGVSPQQIGVGIRGVRAAVGARAGRAIRPIPAPAQAVTRDISEVLPELAESRVARVARPAERPTRLDIETGIPDIRDVAEVDVPLQTRAPQQVTPEFNVPRPIRELKASEGQSRFIAPDSAEFAEIKQFAERHVEPGFGEVRLTAEGVPEVTIGTYLDPVSGERLSLVVDPRVRGGRSAAANRGRLAIRTDATLGTRAPRGTITPDQIDAVSRTTDDLFRDVRTGVQQGDVTITPAGEVRRIDRPIGEIAPRVETPNVPRPPQPELSPTAIRTTARGAIRPTAESTASSGVPPRKGGRNAPTTPDEFPSHQPSSVLKEKYGARAVESGLTKKETFINSVKFRLSGITILGRSLGRTPVRGIRENLVLTTEGAQRIMKERIRINPRIESVAKLESDKVVEQAKQIFPTMRANLQIPFLGGVDKAITGAPTLSDVAARLPRYKDALSSDQLRGLELIRDEFLDPRIREMLIELGDDVGDRPDIITNGGGFYIPRGSAA